MICLNTDSEILPSPFVIFTGVNKWKICLSKWRNISDVNTTASDVAIGLTSLNLTFPKHGYIPFLILGNLGH